ncbi:hypothetical protein BpHYR1_024917 [Brachionus plicatilis]|uniref:Uncharacterized protein n=1 Tax=Brachionus plicatilis TaxID=10195 RepID=A0A3M7RZ92_BRAPC|nr:hypothetical protein BpHYR1_024917 [Brachionus plicatilis]
MVQNDILPKIHIQRKNFNSTYCFEFNMDSKDDVQDIELIDIEDIVPFGGNSLFLSVARVLIYMSQKNIQFSNALNLCINLTKNDLASDINLQSMLRTRLCEYWIKTGVHFDEKQKLFYLSKDFSAYFNGNVYDFLIQVYQMSINNFSNNPLYKKYALGSLSKMLKMRIYYKKSNGTWKCYSPNRRQVEKKKIAIDNQNIVDLMEYLNGQTIYLQEFKYDRAGQSLFVNKNIRFLLDKKLWLLNHHENSKICMKFSQFNDTTELNLYQDEYFLLDCKRLVQIFLSHLNDITLFEKVFCVFIYKVPIEIIVKEHKLSSEQSSLFYDKEKTSFDFSPEFNTIGKQILKLEQLNHLDESLFIKYMNFLWREKGAQSGKFTKEIINIKRTQSGLTRQVGVEKI